MRRDLGQGLAVGLDVVRAPEHDRDGLRVCTGLLLLPRDDFSRFLVHKALHRIPVLWSIHKVHHSAEYLTPFTVYRTHPLEGVIFAFRSIIVQAITISSFVFLFGGKIDLITI